LWGQEIVHLHTSKFLANTPVEVKFEGWEDSFGDGAKHIVFVLFITLKESGCCLAFMMDFTGGFGRSFVLRGNRGVIEQSGTWIGIARSHSTVLKREPLSSARIAIFAYS
jgi:hypothetical protein